MRAQNVLVSLFILVCLSFCLQARREKGETISVTAVGEAVGNGLAAKEKSRENALRAAVEKGFGVYIDSATLTENAALIHDDVVAETRGFVKYYDILEQKELDGFFTTKVRAEVSIEKIWESKSMELLLQRMGAPRFVIIAAESHEGRPTTKSFALQKVTERLVARGFNLVNASNTKNLSFRQVKNVLSNSQQAAKIGKKANAEIIVLVDSSGAFLKKARSYGTNFTLFRGNCAIRAVQVDSRKIVASSVSECQSGSVKDAIMDAAEDNAEEIVKQLMAAWSNYLNMGRSIELVVTHVSVSKLMQIIEQLKSVEGVRDVQQRNFAGKRAQLEIKSKHKAMYLAESIENLPGVKLEISSFSADRIVVRNKN